MHGVHHQSPVQTPLQNSYSPAFQTAKQNQQQTTQQLRAKSALDCEGGDWMLDRFEDDEDHHHYRDREYRTWSRKEDVLLQGPALQMAEEEVLEPCMTEI